MDYGSDNWDNVTENVLRFGTVVDRRMTTKGPEVRVWVPDRGVATDFLPVGQHGTVGASMHWCPRKGEQVLVAHSPDHIEQGVVVCSMFTDNNPSPLPRSINSIAMQAHDGAFFEYDPDAKCLSINGIGTLYLNMLGEGKVITGGDLAATVGGNLNATVSGTATVTAPTVNVNAGSSITLNSPKVTCTGTFFCDQFKPYQAAAPLANPHMTNQDGSGAGA